jgi:hypothetical protein
VKSYNKFMGGVYQHDQLRMNYTVVLHGLWLHTIFITMLWHALLNTFHFR